MIRTGPCLHLVGKLLKGAVAVVITLGGFLACDDEAARKRPPGASAPLRERSSPSDSTAHPSRTSAELNVVLITLDTARADALGAYGQPRPTSPHIDRLAAEGVLFEQVLASTPSTLPSHATIFTGKLPFVHGVRSNLGYVLSEDNVTLAEVLTRNGYRTGAEVATPVLRRDRRLDQGFGRYRDPQGLGVEPRTAVPAGDAAGEASELLVRLAADITRHGIDFIRENAKRRFFLWLHYFDPHRPYSAPEIFNRRIPDSPYHAEIAYADAQIGLVVDELRRLGLKDRTLVILTSDHGEGLGDHEEATHSYYVYETTMRVPLIFWGPPPLVTGARVESLARTADIAPTILDLVGLPPLEGVQGVSLRPLLVGEETDLDLTGYGESIEMYTTFNASPLRVVRDSRWKYIHKVNPEFYDLREDPDERANLASRETEQVARLLARLEQMLADVSSPGENAAVGVDGGTERALIALGYVGGVLSAERRAELDSLDLSGGDANLLAGDVQEIAIGIGLLRRKRWDEGVASLQGLAGKHPESVPILIMLVRALEKAGRGREAVPIARRMVELDPGDTGHHVRLVELLSETGQVEGAIAALWPLLELDACAEQRRMHLYSLLQSRRDYTELSRMTEQGYERCPESAWNLNAYAWVLATSPVASLRDGALAVRVAERLVSSVEADELDSGYLDTLAVAHAEAGRFDRAIDAALRALSLARERAEPRERIESFEGHLADFRLGRAVRDS